MCLNHAAEFALQRSDPILLSALERGYFGAKLEGGVQARHTQVHRGSDTQITAHSGSRERAGVRNGANPTPDSSAGAGAGAGM